MAIAGISTGLTITNPTTVTRQNIQTTEPVSLTAEPVDAVQRVEVTQQESLQTDALLQNEVLVNEVFRNILSQNNQLQTGQLFNTGSPPLAALTETQGLTPLQQNALLVSEILQNLNFVPQEPANAFLINEISPALEAAGIDSQLDLLQGNAQLVNETLQTIGLDAIESNTDLIQPGATSVETNIPTNFDELVVAPLPAAVTDETDRASITAQTSGTQQTGDITPQPVAITEPADLDTFPIPPQVPTPATLPLTLFPDRTPYVLAAYLINDPTQIPDTPELGEREVEPITPVAENQAVGVSRFRQLLQSAREGRRADEPENPAIRINVGQAEKSIRMTLDQVNDDMTAQESPLHFVVAKHGNELALDVYDCSYDEACHITYDIPITLNKLDGVLNNLHHQSGIIVNTPS